MNSEERWYEFIRVDVNRSDDHASYRFGCSSTAFTLVCIFAAIAYFLC